MLTTHLPPSYRSEPIPAKVKLRGVRKQFVLKNRAFDALEGIDLEVAAGEFLCIVGPSGCGKTTLLRILADLEQPTSGTVELVPDGSDTPLECMVFQEHGVFPWMNVRDNVAFGLKARGYGRRQRYALADTYIQEVGLTGFEAALPHQLSGGMKQRVSLARAFANGSQMLLMDEPFASVDEQNKLVLQAELLHIWEAARKTVVYVTHSIDEAIMLADRVVVMSARPGRVRDVIDVGAYVERPRVVDSVKSSPAYGELFQRIWSQLRDEVGRP